MSPRGLSRRRERGITLVEVLAAVAVLAIALIAIFQVIERQTRSTDELSDRMFAHWVAVNRMEEARILGGDAAAAGEEVEQLGGIDWRVDVRREDGPYGLERLEIAVSAEDRPGAFLVGFVQPEAEQ